MSWNRKFSVIVPAFNAQDGLDRLLNAISQQTVDKDTFEVIVVDNGSEPPLKISKTRSFECKLIRCPVPGSYSARNAGVKESSGEYLAFIDADCIPMPSWLDAGIEALQRSGDETAIGGEVKIIKTPGETLTSKYQRLIGFQQDYNISKKIFSVTANLLCSRAAFQKVGFFDESLFSGGDAEWCWRAHSLGVLIRHAPDVVVETLPRHSLKGAIMQARRVVAGRKQLARRGIAPPDGGGHRKSPSIIGSATTIMNLDAPALDRVGILGIAVVIRLATVFESIRLALGSVPERR